MRIHIMAALTLSAAACTVADKPEPGSDGPGDVAVPPAAVTTVSVAEAQSPLLGTWRVVSVGDAQYPDPATGVFPNVRFDSSGFLSHWAGCGGAFPAFYALDGRNIAITRREAVRIGKCESAAAAERERALATALDAAHAWSTEGDRLVLAAAGGTRIVLARPTEPIPELAGRWTVLTIGGTPLGSVRPATVQFSRGFLGAAADCNALSTQYAAGREGGLRVTGQLIATQMACAPVDMARDARLFGALGAVTGWAIDGEGRLTLSGPQALVLRRPLAGETTDRLPSD